MVWAPQTYIAISRACDDGVVSFEDEGGKGLRGSVGVVEFQGVWPHLLGKCQLQHLHELCAKNIGDWVIMAHKSLVSKYTQFGRRAGAHINIIIVNFRQVLLYLIVLL